MIVEAEKSMAEDTGEPPFSFQSKATSFETSKELMSQFESRVSVCLSMCFSVSGQAALDGGSNGNVTNTRFLKSIEGTKFKSSTGKVYVYICVYVCD
ncbi:hypothetical protein STEG23_023705 [Scotinomys teguina]